MTKQFFFVVETGNGGPTEQHFVVPANTQPGALKYCSTQHLPSLGHADGCCVVFHVDVGQGTREILSENNIGKEAMQFSRKKNHIYFFAKSGNLRSAACRTYSPDTDA
jgi:hypothetical protein